MCFESDAEGQGGNSRYCSLTNNSLFLQRPFPLPNRSQQLASRTRPTYRTDDDHQDTPTLPTRARLALETPELDFVIYPYDNTTRLFIYETCTNATETTPAICTRTVETVTVKGTERTWRCPHHPLTPMYIYALASQPVAAIKPSDLSISNAPGWTVTRVQELPSGVEFIFRVDPVLSTTPVNATLRIPERVVSARNDTSNLNSRSNGLFVYLDTTPPAPTLEVFKRSPLVFTDVVNVKLDFGEPLMENCFGGTCLYEAVGEDGTTVPSLSSYDPDTGTHTHTHVPPRSP